MSNTIGKKVDEIIEIKDAEILRLAERKPTGLRAFQTLLSVI
jgi:hypothetical protein